jgi:hypothetical protein
MVGNPAENLRARFREILFNSNTKTSRISDNNAAWKNAQEFSKQGRPSCSEVEASKGKSAQPEANRWYPLLDAMSSDAPKVFSKYHRLFYTCVSSAKSGF